VLLENNFVFRENPDGSYMFVGDFDGLYEAESDPWGQSGTDERLKDYYAFSRMRLINLVKQKTTGRILEVGCGLGFVVDKLNKNIPDREIAGLDISGVAINLARKKFPHHIFIEKDITEVALLISKFDVIILNQVLWYILERLLIALINCHRALNDGGHLILSQAFLKDCQRYGADISEGYIGFMTYFHRVQKQDETFHLIYGDYDRSDRFEHHDGLALFEKVPW